MALIDRTGAAALIPEEVSREIIQAVPDQSAVMQLSRRLPNMSRKQQRMPVLDSLITAGFVDGDTGLKATTEAAWDNVYLNAEEIAVIVPIPEAVLADADYPIWDEIKDRIPEAFGKVIDGARLIGTNAPASWPDDILTGATAASQILDLSTQVTAGDDLYDVVLGEIAAGTPGLIGMVEADGYMPSGHVAVMAMRGKLRALRSSTGEPLFMRSLNNGQNMQSDTRYELDGEPMYFLKNGAVPATTALMFTGDWKQQVYSIRQDITYKILTEAVIQAPDGSILYNLAQQDMVALRCVMRIAFAVPNPINNMNTNDTTRYPWAVLVP